MALIPYTWNADRELLASSRNRYTLSVGHKNFRKLGSSIWQPIRAEIASDLTATQFAASVQFPSNSQGWTNMLFDGGFSTRRYIDERNGDNSEPAFALDMAVETQHNVAGEIDPDRPSHVVYRGAWDSADLRLGIWKGRATRIEKVVEIHSKPAGSDEFVSYSFLLRSSTAKVWAGPNFNVRPWAGRPSDKAEVLRSKIFIGRGASQLRGALLREPSAWYDLPDGTTVREPIRVTFEILGDGETVRATKHIPRTLIREAHTAGVPLKLDAIFTPDGNPESNSADGYTQNLTEGSWASLTGGTGDTADFGSSNNFGLAYYTPDTSQWDNLSRLMFWYDTSSLDASHTVTDATFTPYAATNGFGSHLDETGTAPDIGVFGNSSTNVTTVTNSDFENSETTPFTDSPQTWPPPSDATFDLVFNMAGKSYIKLDGLTRLTLAFHSYDLAGLSTPTHPGTSAKYTVVRGVPFAEHSSLPAAELEVITAAAGPTIPIVMHHYKQMMGAN